MTKDDYCLIVGAGSIGERYIRNLWELGHKNIVVLRRKNLPFRNIAQARVQVTTSWDEALLLRPKIAFVCNPTSMHLSSAMVCVENGIHVLVEKPLSHTIDGLPELAAKAIEKNTLVQVGYMMRFHPFLNKVFQLILHESFGKLLQIQSHWGEYLPDWHPWEDYRESYAAKSALGGGVALTLSHDLDLANWMAGAKVIKCQKNFNFRSGLQVDVESGADFLLQYGNGVNANVHLNYFQKVKERFYQYIFEDAVVKIDFFRNELIVSKKEGETIEYLEGFDRNDLFLQQIKYFFSAIDHPSSSQSNIAESELIINLCVSNE